MSTTVTVSDRDCLIDFMLAVDYGYRPAVASRAGWRDGGSCGSAAAIDLVRARCVEIAIVFGPHAITVRPAERAVDRASRDLGNWCLEEYAAEIEQALWREIRRQRPLLMI